MLIFYRAGIRLYALLIRLASPFSQKAAKFRQGRRRFFKKHPAIETEKKVAWFHCASLGEFEQARPIIESFDKADYFILISFFSPSGYEIRKDYQYADLVTYLPLDTRRNARRWYKHFKPSIVFFIKYEFWYHFIMEGKKRDIPVYLLSAVFRPGQIFFRPWGGVFRRVLRAFTAIYVQDKVSLKQVSKLRTENVHLTGDTRFDRVSETKANAKPLPFMDKFANGKKVVVLGSSWPAEEMLMAKYIDIMHPDIKVVIVPHDISPKRIASIRSTYEEVQIFTEMDEDRLSEVGILVIDAIGLLSALYQHADIAFVGGGFGKGLHNILEPAVFGVPVIYGPKISKFYEAKELKKAGGGFSIESQEEFDKIINTLILDQFSWKQASEAAAEFCESRKGATQKVLKLIGRS